MATSQHNNNYPESHSITKHDILPVLDQKELGSCFTNAICSALEYAQLKNNDSMGLIQPSRLFMYQLSEQYGLAKISGIPPKAGDTGGFQNALAVLIENFGVCSNKYAPYPSDDFFRHATKEKVTALLSQSPSSVQLEMAKKQLQAFAYLKVWQSMNPVTRDVALTVTDPHDADKRLAVFEKDPIDLIRWSITEKDFPVNMLVPIFNNFYTDYGSSFGIVDMPGPDDHLAGQHALLAIGYNDDYVFPSGAKGAVMFQNSWGGNWPSRNYYDAAAGYGFLPYAFFYRFSICIGYGPIVTKCVMTDTIPGAFSGIAVSTITR